MTVEALWAAAAAAVEAEFATLPPRRREEVARIVPAIGALKSRAAFLAAAESVCEACRGICCGFGKHHFSVVDLLAYLVGEQELFVPRFDNPLCPYHTGSGCIMGAALRPLTCTIFICEQIEERLTDTVKQELAGIEKELRRLYGELEQLLGNRFENGLIITYERSLLSGRTLFRY